MKAYIFVIALLVCIFGSIAGYKYIQFSALANASYERPPISVAAGIAAVDEWTDYLDAVGTVKAVRGIQLTSEESGEITEINFDSGENVEAGQLMMVLNDRVEVARLESQKATLKLAELLFSRNKELLLEKSVSQSDYDRSKADLDRARADLAETRAILANKRIRAPFTGTAGIRQLDLGDYVSPGTVLATLQDLSELELDFTLPSRSSPRIEPGQRIEFQVDAFLGRSFRARLIALDSQIDPDTRNLIARARVEDGDGLLPGMFAYLQLYLGSRQEVLTVPETAVTYSLHGDVVYVIDEAADGALTTTSTIVKTGETQNSRTRILSGLEENSRVVTSGQNKLYRGASVVIDNDPNF